jgi:hypothetical protein
VGGRLRQAFPLFSVLFLLSDEIFFVKLFARMYHYLSQLIPFFYFFVAIEQLNRHTLKNPTFAQTEIKLLLPS